MNLFFVAAAVIAAFSLGYRFYGRLLARTMDLKPDTPTPAEKMNDGVDFVPTRPAILVGQHFAAIAAVGPIVGPIIAGITYGWLPALMWIVLGAIFIGGVHDFSALVASVRHDAKSVAELMKQYVSPRAYFLFLLFIWISLLYVIVVFTDLTAAAFVSAPYGGGVATSSIIYLGLAIGMGVLLYKFNFPLRYATAIFIPLLLIIIWGGQFIPIHLPSLPFATDQQLWDLAILGYCVIASLIPMWLLLQPRGYLGSIFLYGTFFAGFVGMLLGGLTISYPALQPGTQFWPTLTGAGFPIFPLMFVTIACGACSGFHGIVSSGTTSKQLHRETDALPVGYGGMLLEGIVALIALTTIMTLSAGSQTLTLSPDEIYAQGIARFMSIFGIPFGLAVTFGKLAFATFIYDTLDVATRLGRYIFQELTGWKDRLGAYLATLATVAIPIAIIFWKVGSEGSKVIPLWKIFWPVFGASNQLVAALSLLGITIWLRKNGKNPWITGIPALFMILITIWSLVLLAQPLVARLMSGSLSLDPVGAAAIVLLVVGVSVIWEGRRGFVRAR